MENAKELFEGFIKTAVSPVLINDAIELYARQEIISDDDREEFIEKYNDERYLPILGKAVLDAVVAVVAGLQVVDDAVFRGVMGLLDVEEDDEMVAEMKRVMLLKLTDDACGDLSSEAEMRLRDRMQYVLKLIA